MRLVGLMLVRNESWAVEAVLESALKWVDHLCILLDRCTDRTTEIVLAANDGRISVETTESDTLWMEMTHRQRTLDMGRAAGGTHFAVIDGDELLTANVHGQVRGWFEALAPRELIELPRIAPVSHTHYWSDRHEHAGGAITLGFMDHPDLAWKPRGSEAYHFHGRPPHGSGNFNAPLGRDRTAGGIMHLQYMNRNRMRAKSLWYMLNERVRWPDRKTPQELCSIYGAMLDSPQETSPIPEEWWGIDKSKIKIESGPSWHLDECLSLVDEYGRGILQGLDTRGYAI